MGTKRIRDETTDSAPALGDYLLVDKVTPVVTRKITISQIIGMVGGGSPSGSAGGDLSGTYPSPSVVDDSHNHTVATLPATMPPSAHTHPTSDIVSGVFPISQLATGTPTGSKFIRDDGVLAVLPSPSNATTSVAGTVVLATPSSDVTAGHVVQASDTRLSDARTPSAHVHAGTDITSGTVALARLPTIPTSQVSGLAASATTDTTNASNISSGTLAAGRVATLNQNTTGSAGSLSTINDVAHGGTGVNTFTPHGVVLGNGASAVSVTSSGTSGQVLTSNGSGADPTFQSSPGAPVTTQKPLDQKVDNSAATVNDTALIATLSPSTKYWFSFEVHISDATTFAAGGFAGTLGGTATYTNFRAQATITQNTNLVLGAAESWSGTGGSLAASNGDASMFLKVEGSCEVSSGGGGTLLLQWAQMVATIGQLSVLRDSTVRYGVIP
jgi:hypothetical protein